MANEAIIKRATIDDLKARREHGESRSDLATIRSKTEAELQRDVATDPDFSAQATDWYLAA